MRQIDLAGPDGNAFALMAMAQTWGKQLGLDTQAIIADMQSGDYEHLLEVFETNFQHVAVLLNKPGDESEDS